MFIAENISFILKKFRSHWKRLYSNFDKHYHKTDMNYQLYNPVKDKIHIIFGYFGSFFNSLSGNS